MSSKKFGPGLLIIILQAIFSSSSPASFTYKSTPNLITTVECRSENHSEKSTSSRMNNKLAVGGKGKKTNRFGRSSCGFKVSRKVHENGRITFSSSSSLAFSHVQTLNKYLQPRNQLVPGFAPCLMDSWELFFLSFSIFFNFPSSAPYS